jgi:hypothetical protein
MKRCFVISPIGDEGSEVREHANDVFDFIIVPAMKELGIEAYRSDHSHEVGKISDQMFRSILHDDLCVAVLTFHNPNVYYELAVAQSAARPVVILVQKGTALPFDVKDMRTVHYDLKPRPIKEGVYSKEIVEKVRHLEHEATRRVVPFAPDLSPLGGSRHFRSFVKAEDYGPSDRWVDLLREASTRFDLCGISVGSWIKPLGIKELFTSRAREGCQVRTLVMAPSNPALPCLLNVSAHQGSISKTKQQIQDSTAFFQSIQPSKLSVQSRYMESVCPHQLLVLNDVRAVVVPYLYSAATFSSPLFEFSRESEFYGVFSTEFNSLWDQSVQDLKEITAEQAHGADGPKPAAHA